MTTFDSTNNTITPGAVEAVLHYWLQKLEYDLNGETVEKPEYDLGDGSEEPLNSILSEAIKKTFRNGWRAKQGFEVSDTFLVQTVLDVSYILGVRLATAVVRDSLGDPLPAIRAAIEDAEKSLWSPDAKAVPA